MSAAGTRSIRFEVLLAACGGAALFLLLVLALELHAGLAGSAVPVPPARAGDETSRPEPVSAFVSLEAVEESERVILARPVFSPQRRPPSVAVAGPQQPRLSGIIVGPNGRRAIFAGAGDARGTVVDVGGQAGAWRVLAINDHAVRVSGPDGVRTLHPSRDKAAAADDASPGGDPSHPSILDLLRSRAGTRGVAAGLMGGQLPLPQNGDAQVPQQTAPAAPE
ncbi:hypothetical protein NFI95_12820 [Acetobacteraceae bacterium KSS8]|uniref:Type II secretion system protein GspC N-terminal domain-containing protein n=1 Tax=Endosaccharibacter trunci TaxID=2812733 RepID=A0ABT1W8V9_9PROT|nr:hypothetical protein [Acetobacteraceae bacterium KSS8]